MSACVNAPDTMKNSANRMRPIVMNTDISLPLPKAGRPPASEHDRENRISDFPATNATRLREDHAPTKVPAGNLTPCQIKPKGRATRCATRPPRMVSARDQYGPQ